MKFSAPSASQPHRRRSARRACLMLGLGLSTLLGTIATPAMAGTELRVRVELGGRAKIVDEGASATIRVAGTCTAGAQVLEAFVYITQDGNTSSFGSFPLVCDGLRHAWRVEVQAFDAPFHAGAATASGYALIEDDSGRTADDSPFRDITMVE